jgi:hypothetical protein
MEELLSAYPTAPCAYLAALELSSGHMRYGIWIHVEFPSTCPYRSEYKRYGGMGEKLENARVLVKIGDGEGGESVTIQTDGRAEDGEDSSVESVFVGLYEVRDDWWRRYQLRPKHTTFVGCQFEVEFSEKGDEARDHCGSVLGGAREIEIINVRCSSRIGETTKYSLVYWMDREAK